MSTTELKRFLILIAGADHFARWDAADDATRDEAFAGYRAFTAAVRERGRFRGGEALVHPNDARTLRPDGAGRRVTEGPYAETVEQLGGFYLVDLPDLATAIEVGSLLPRDYDIEVRECLDVGVPDE
ncbi:YCII-related protein [Kribbella flavida DSM 17836]|uniref:YCII-related protein n=1 Tax=Kribbella flavida (strain DSM 17836 / JCM 10339 / NBRC 14399) TaxID=479435 RepID=D2PR27_KRIFD|nr:YciI family protein [Kribbella flavida]ADB32975.1 YCII-related protein [Kribbella flavida DSM 17836]